MIRIPGSLNSKYPEGKNEVKIIPKMGWIQTTDEFAAWCFPCLPYRPEDQGR